MKFLISNDFKALRQGDFVKASENSNEFVFDTENSNLAAATLLEIAKSNKVSLTKQKNIDLMVSDLETGLLNLKLPEMNKMSESENILKIVTEGFTKGLEDDDILINIVNSGIKFKRAAGLFKKCLQENGLRISSKERQKSIWAILEDNEFAPETYDGVVEMSERLSVGRAKDGLEPVKDTTTQIAIKEIKKFCKEMEIEFPKAPKKPKGGLRSRYLEFAAKNPAITDAELEDWYVENTKDKDQEDIQKWIEKYSYIINHGRAVAKAAMECGEVAEVVAKA